MVITRARADMKLAVARQHAQEPQQFVRPRPARVRSGKLKPFLGALGLYNRWRAGKDSGNFASIPVSGVSRGVNAVLVEWGSFD